MNSQIKLILLTLCLTLLCSDSFSQTRMKLDEAIKTSIENNQALKTSKLNIEKENAVKLRSFNIPKPEVFIEYEGVNGSLSNADSRKIGFQQQFEFPTNYFLRSDVQSSQILVANEELNIEINNLTEKVKLNFNQLLLLTELLKSAEDNFKSYEEFSNIAEKKYSAGETSSLEVLGAKVNRIKYNNEISNLRSQIKSVQSELKNLMNIDYEILPEGELIFREMALSESVITQIVLNNNPEVKVFKYRKEKLFNKISLSKGELLPDISFKYFRQKIEGVNDYWGMEVGLGIPLWFWWDQSGSIKESKLEHQIASSEEISFKQSLETQVSRTFEEYENNLRQVKFYQTDVLKESEEILRQSKISYSEGEIGYVEYLQALNLAYETKTQYLNAIYNYNQSIINLEKLTSGDLK